MANPTAAHVLSVARQELGTEESPHGSNRVKYSLWYGLIGPWCAMFISWVAARAGATKIIPRHAWTPAGAAWFKSQHRWSRTPRVGDIVYYQFPGISGISHVGIVESIYHDGSWIAIEGNTDEAGGRTGGKVMRKHRYSVGSAGGFGHPAYATQPPPPIVAGNVKSWQTILEFGPRDRDGQFGPNTNQRSEWMRNASRRIDAMPGRTGKSTVKLIQRIVDTPDDGVWGPASRARLIAWIKEAQRFLAVPQTGVWDAKTDAAYVAFRNRNYRK